MEPLRARVSPLPAPTTLKTKTDLALAQTLRRAHPLFAPTVLLFLQVRSPKFIRLTCIFSASVVGSRNDAERFTLSHPPTAQLHGGLASSS